MQFVLFNLIGVLTTLLGMVVYFLAIKLGWHYTMALVEDYAFGIWFSFFMNKRFTFRVEGKATPVMFCKMVLSYFLLFAGNLVLLALSVDFLGINVYLAQVVSYGAFVVFSFAAQKFFVFRVTSS